MLSMLNARPGLCRQRPEKEGGSLLFLRTLAVTYCQPGGEAQPVPIAWLDSFAMRNFTNSAVFDDTLPVGDGLLEVGLRVSLPELATAMQDWFRRKVWIGPGSEIQVKLLLPRAK